MKGKKWLLSRWQQAFTAVERQEQASRRDNTSDCDDGLSGRGGGESIVIMHRMITAVQVGKMTKLVS